MTFSPRDPLFWDEAGLDKEIHRIFDICHGCRLCFNLCPSFPRLFDAVDALDTTAASTEAAVAASLAKGHATPEGEHGAAVRDDVRGQAEALERLPEAVHQDVADLCYQCKLCDPICPYTPPHEFAVDFPRLMLRRKAIHAKEHGVSLQDRLLGDPDLVGKVGTMVPAIANMANKVKANRILMEAALGIHRDRQLPEFARQPFLEWFRSRPQPRPPAEVSGPKVVLFYTCTVQWNDPQVGRAAVEVLEHNGFTVYAPEFKCCGMPALDGGDVDRATAWANANLDVLLPYVEAGCDIVSPGPTCSYMLKKEWAFYIEDERVKKVAARGYDLMEFLFNLRKAGKMREDYQGDAGAIGYHLPCHLKVQKIGFRSRDVLKRLPGAKVTLVDQCSCMDGTWGMKKQYYDLSKKGAKKLLDGLEQSGAPTMSSDCMIAKLQIEEGTGKKVLHPIELLWKAYGGTDTTPLSKLPPVEAP